MAAFAVAFTVAAAVMPLVIRLSPAVGAMDLPGDARRIHTRPTPRMGGLGILAALLAGAALFPSPTAQLTSAGGALVAAVGLTDDVFSLSPRWKLLGQTASALLLPLWGFSFQSLRLFAWRLPLSPFGGSTLTVLFAVALMNAVNFTDGLDGLAAGCVLPCALLFGGNAPLLAGATAGFLLYNAPPAKTFLGDTGSLLLGYGMAVLLLLRSTSLSLPLLLPAVVPLSDLLFAVIRRALRRQSPFAADREHIHHKLLRAGFSAKRVTLTLTALSSLFAAVGFWLA